MAVNNWVWFGPLSLAMLLGSIFYAYPYPVLNTYGGRLGEANMAVTHIKHLGHGPLNNGRCWTNKLGKACEDVRIHHGTATAFLACGYPETRESFYPPINRHDTSSARTYHEYFVKYDIKKDTASKLKLEGIDSSFDLVLHGIDILEPKDDPSKIYIFAVNHARKGEAILLFSHVLGSDTFKFVREFTHPLIKTPNAVAHTSMSSFFISNDHYYYGGGPIATLLRSHEDSWGPFRWASDIVHCSVVEGSWAGASATNLVGDLDCKVVSPVDGHPSANGVLLVDEGKTLLVNDIMEATTTVYDVDAETKMLTVRKKVILGAAADNLSEIPGTGDIAVAVFPDPGKIQERLGGEHILNSEMIGQAGVLRLIKAKDYEPELFYWDDGSLVTVLTGVAIDPKHGKLIAGGVVERHFVVCDVEV